MSNGNSALISKLVMLMAFTGTRLIAICSGRPETSTMNTLICLLEDVGLAGIAFAFYARDYPVAGGTPPSAPQAF